jgi:diacylglycerol kinase (ATP)
MACCAILASLIAAALWLAARVAPQRARSPGSALAWRLEDQMGLASEPSGSTALTESSRLRSIGFALAGLRRMVASEPNAQLHLGATVLVVAAGLLLRVDGDAWRWLALAIGWVWCAEALNTAVEQVCDVVSPELNDAVRIAKDVAAGAVLVSAIAAVIIGVLTFAPYVAAADFGGLLHEHRGNALP